MRTSLGFVVMALASLILLATGVQAAGYICLFNAPHGGSSPQTSPVQPPLSDRNAAILNFFNDWAAQRDPRRFRGARVPVMTLVNLKNAMGGSFGIAVNPQYMTEVGDVNSTGILAHELGHVAQQKGLIRPEDQDIETQADSFGGWLLRASGLISQKEFSQFEDFVRQMPGGDGSHAPGPTRAQTFDNGYYRSNFKLGMGKLAPRPAPKMPPSGEEECDCIIGPPIPGLAPQD